MAFRDAVNAIAAFAAARNISRDMVASTLLRSNLIPERTWHDLARHFKDRGNDSRAPARGRAGGRPKLLRGASSSRRKCPSSILYGARLAKARLRIPRPDRYWASNPETLTHFSRASRMWEAADAVLARRQYPDHRQTRLLSDRSGAGVLGVVAVSGRSGQCQNPPRNNEEIRQGRDEDPLVEWIERPETQAALLFQETLVDAALVQRTGPQLTRPI